MPDLSPDQICATVRGSFPPDIIAELLDGMVRANVKARADVRREPMSPLTRRDAFGHSQRMHIEGDLQHLPERCPAVRVAVKQTQRKTSSYTLVSAATVGMTVSARKGDRLPRHADFRRSLARKAQLTLFAVPEDEARPDGALYAILLYDFDPTTLELNYAALVVPDRSCAEVVASIPLTQELQAAQARAAASVLEHEPAVAEEKIDEPARPALRQKKGADRAEGA